MSLTCADCGSEMLLKSSRFGPFYGCVRYPECLGTHGAHPDGKPLGIPADKETRIARIKAHKAFDKLWKQGGMTRPEAYRLLSEEFGENSHIGQMTRVECERVIIWTSKRSHENAAG